LHRLCGVFLTAMDADEIQIEASFCEAIRIAKEQKSVSLEKRAEADYAQYRRRKDERLGHGLLPEQISAARLQSPDALFLAEKRKVPIVCESPKRR